jgi:hypothetical protein
MPSLYTAVAWQWVYISQYSPIQAWVSQVVFSLQGFRLMCATLPNGNYHLINLLVLLARFSSVFVDVGEGSRGRRLTYSRGQWFWFDIRWLDFLSRLRCSVYWGRRGGFCLLRTMVLLSYIVVFSIEMFAVFLCWTVLRIPTARCRRSRWVLELLYIWGLYFPVTAAIVFQ